MECLARQASEVNGFVRPDDHFRQVLVDVHWFRSTWNRCTVPIGGLYVDNARTPKASTFGVVHDVPIRRDCELCLAVVDSYPSAWNRVRFDAADERDTNPDGHADAECEQSNDTACAICGH